MEIDVNGKAYSGRFKIMANLALAFPFLAIVCLYSEWITAWLVLGHQPVPSLNDPKDIAVSNLMHPITWAATMLQEPVALVALIINARYLTKGFTMVGLIRVFLVVGLWLGAIAFFRWDPYRVGEWWID